LFASQHARKTRFRGQSNPAMKAAAKAATGSLRASFLHFIYGNAVASVNSRNPSADR